jgi:hypothetical protein
MLECCAESLHARDKDCENDPHKQSHASHHKQNDKGLVAAQDGLAGCKVDVRKTLRFEEEESEESVEVVRGLFTQIMSKCLRAA